MKVYLVTKDDNVEYIFSNILKAFSTLEKAKAHVQELKEKYKDNISFNLGNFTFEIVEMIVE